MADNAKWKSAPNDYGWWYHTCTPTCDYMVGEMLEVRKITTHKTRFEVWKNGDWRDVSCFDGLWFGPIRIPEPDWKP